MRDFKCPKCDSRNVIIKQVGARIGAYCKSCYAWITWVDSADIARIRKRTKYDEKTQALRKFIRAKGKTIIKCGSCQTLLYNSSKPVPEGQFNLMDANYCPYCGKELL